MDLLQRSDENMSFLYFKQIILLSYSHYYCAAGQRLPAVAYQKERGRS